jgi:selenophosphate synthase
MSRLNQLLHDAACEETKVLPSTLKSVYKDQKFRSRPPESVVATDSRYTRPSQRPGVGTGLVTAGDIKDGEENFPSPPLVDYVMDGIKFMYSNNATCSRTALFLNRPFRTS